MSDWQKTLHQSVDTLDKLAERFGNDVIDVPALGPAFDNFQMRLTPKVLGTIKEIGRPFQTFSRVATAWRSMSPRTCSYCSHSGTRYARWLSP